MLFEGKFKELPVDQVDLANDDYKVSKPLTGNELRESIRKFGILDPPVVLKKEKIYIPVSGHNRLRILNDEKISSIKALTIDVLNPDSFIKYAYLKNYRGEVGAGGKLKFVEILNDLNNSNKYFTDNRIQDIIKRINLPEEVIAQKEPWNRYKQLPDNLKEYVDSRDISFKLIKKVLQLNEGITLLSKWIMPEMRVNIFRGLIDLLIDIYRRDKSFKEPEKIDLTSFKDKKARESELYSRVFRIRYPEYSGMKSSADKLINDFKGKNIEIDFPEFFESDEIGVKLKIKKREDMNIFRQKLDSIDLNKIQDLLNML